MRLHLTEIVREGLLKHMIMTNMQQMERIVVVDAFANCRYRPKGVLPQRCSAHFLTHF